MALGIGLIVLSLAGLGYGIIMKRKPFIILSVIALAIIVLLWAGYTYLYSLNPY